GKIQKATILTSKDMKDHNTFEKPNVVAPANFKGATIKDGKLIVDMPKMSIVTIQIK
ncbi:MAG: alpha-N-arabinofuranosidase, partial [Bacteroidaceae bacterium]|nr:alpha-N-arabinofuranosidase [Bacteroidaceae bacterium]